MQATPSFADTADAPVRPGAPLLLVRDLDRVARYYEQTIGLHLLHRDKDEAHLGAGSRTLLTLRQRAKIDLEPRGFAGLFHTAFLMPDRPALGRWLLRAIEDRTEFEGAADHLVSEAFYLQDPEGNGIEVYADRPRDQWTWHGTMVEMASNEADVRGIVMSGGGVASPTARVPDDTTVGHVHLRVGGIPEAEAFYNGILGLDVTARMPGATFYATGQYHHHIATNTWQSRGAPKRSGTITGLASFDLIARDQAAFEGAAERMLAKGGQREGEMITLGDPWGNLVQLRQG
jgi:catechol 2,3-dioxygenase